MFHWHSNLASGKAVTVFGVNGSIDASRSSDGEVHVEATKSGPAADRVEVAVSESGDGVLVCAAPIGQKATKDSCKDSALPKDVRVDFKLQIPAGVSFVAHNVNGTVTANSLLSRVEATTVKGDINISTHDTITSVQTESGSLDLAVGKLWTGLLTIKTNSGNIRLKLPRNVAFQPSGKGNTVITGSGPVQLKGLAVAKNDSLKTGPAAPELEISTLHGNVTISTED